MPPPIHRNDPADTDWIQDIYAQAAQEHWSTEQTIEHVMLAERRHVVQLLLDREPLAGAYVHDLVRAITGDQTK